ncbi:Peptidyl-prolyl cis-trans isomerase D [Rhodocyclaceae bacterium]|jgi:peptidyl-prolyl cis-trans isomerase D|nr:Peptidyl-prolyl cis-trans isomerase D [Rhodocyclaceae bacterium]
MFDAVRNNKRIVQVFLALITLPFAFWGVDSYFRSSSGTDELAKVGGSPISRQEFSLAMRDQQERLRGQLGREFNPAMLETPEARLAMLDSLVTQRLLLLHATKSGLTASDAQLIQVISSIPALQEDGQFSKRRYEQALRAQGLTQAGFEAKLRQDLTLQQLVQAVSDTAVVSGAAAERVIAIQLEERQVSEAIIRPEQHAGQLKISVEAVKEFYEKNRKLFEIPQQIRAEFVVLSREALAEQTTISPDDIKSAYEKNAKNYATEEERRASHILIQMPADAPEAEQKAARARIETILQQVKRTPGEFARLAKEHSQDPGSAAKGGDLGFFPRGAMVKPFEEAVFSLKENQISDVVRSEFGFHIIRLTGIKPGKVRSLEEARDSIAAELKLQAAGRKFAEAAESFSNLVYEQADSLKPAAETFKLPLRQTGLFDQQNRAAAGPLASNEKLFAALFSDDALKNKRNTNAIEVAPNTLVAARVVEVRPAELRPLEAVKAEIEKNLAADESARLAQKEGEAKLARLNMGEAVAISWTQPQTVVRQPMRGLAAEAQRVIFKAPADKLPAYAGTQLPNGAYVLYRISQVNSGAARNAADPRAKAQRGQLAQLAGAEDFNAYLAALRQRYGVKIDKAALAKGDDQDAPAPATAPSRPKKSGKF